MRDLDLRLSNTSEIMMHRLFCGGRLAALAALLLGIILRSTFASDVALASGEPDPNCGDLRLWLRADAGVRDSAGHSPADPDFSGSVATWSDQSPHHFDLAAPAEVAPSYVASQPAAGRRPTIAFGGARMLARPEDTLHNHVNATTLLVMQLDRFNERGSVVFTTGEFGGRWESLSFDHMGESEPGLGLIRWVLPTVNRQYNFAGPLQITADGRFVLVIMRSAGEGSSLEIQDGLGDMLGSNREMLPQGVTAISNQCGRGFYLGGNLPSGSFRGGLFFGGNMRGNFRGGRRFGQMLSAFDGQIAEMMVYNRDLSSAERRKLIAYLRNKYELDVLDALFPAGAMLLQAEDFDGTWQLSARWDQLASMCLGNRHVTSREANNEGLRRTVLISRPGNYAVWVRAVNTGREGGLRTLVGGKGLGLTHTQGPSDLSWQLAGKIDLPPGETEIVIRGEGPGRKVCDAVLLSPTANTPADVEEICALARRLRQAPSPCPVAAVFDDGRRIEGSLVSGFKGTGTRIAHDTAARPGVKLLLLEGAATEAAPPSDALLEFQNGDRLRGDICGYAPASAQPGESHGAQLLVQPSPEFTKAGEKLISVDIDWLKRIVFDAAGPPRRCPPRSLVCRDGRVIAFRAVRFSVDGVSVLTAQGLTKIAYRELAELVMQPVDFWEAYHRQLAFIDPQCNVGLVRLETQQGMVFTASSTRVKSFRAESEPAASTCLIQPAWSGTAIPLAWSAVRSEWRAPAQVVPLSQLAPERAIQFGALGSSWKWQADHNVAGGDLQSGGARYYWGFGVHAPTELVFSLPDTALAFRSSLGIDAIVRDSGCIAGKVYVNNTSGTPLFQSKPVYGSQSAVSTGDVALSRGSSPAQHLVLVADGGDGRGPNADPLDIGNHADWLEPTLLLDPVKLRAAVHKFSSTR
jgi:hypothetical protein